MYIVSHSICVITRTYNKLIKSLRTLLLLRSNSLPSERRDMYIVSHSIASVLRYIFHSPFGGGIRPSSVNLTMMKWPSST
ncbi:hypothetical protein HanRHA438_Chr09g0410181 [Helianthus annuus]|nr:hypothetical protein HanIR_Chr09g0429281 [Helianthus annuus]KAJ0889188.1 hypothetical protein HanRHA438_Chr09g0410181 [Helianthus annuus]